MRKFTKGKKLLSAWMIATIVGSMTTPAVPAVQASASVSHVKTTVGTNTVTSAEELPSEIKADETYVLGADIILEQGQQITELSGTLDGNGHTIKLSDKPLAETVSGTIKNLGVTSEKVIQVSGVFGSMAVTLSGTIKNCYSTVAINTAGWDDIGGLVGTLKNGTIKNSYYGGSSNAMFASGLAGVSSQKDSAIANCISTVGFSAVGIMNPEPSITNYQKLTQGALKTLDSVDYLNNDIEDTGFIFALPQEGQNNGMPVLVDKSSVAPEEVDTSVLEQELKKAEQYKEEAYTKESYQVLAEAVKNGMELLEKKDLTKSEVKDATNAITKAIAGLIKKKPTEPVAPPKDESKIIHITSQADLEAINYADADAYYMLDQDITLDNNYWGGMGTLMGVFNGNGHTVTFDNPFMPMFSNVGESGVVQNVHFAGTMGSYGDKGPVGYSLKGSIINCYSELSGDYVCGFAKTLDGGQVINSYSTSQGKKGVLFSKVTSGSLINTYWLKGRVNPVSSSLQGDMIKDSMEKSEEEINSAAFVTLLNANKGTYGTSWGQSKKGNPYFGPDEAQDNEKEELPENRYAVEFVSHDGETKMELTSQTMSVSVDDTTQFGFLGTFRLRGVPEGSKIAWACIENATENDMMVGVDSGEFYVKKEGTCILTATEVKADGTRERAATIAMKATSKQIEAIKLYLNDTEVTGGSHTVKGSEWQNITVYALYEGEKEYVQAIPSRFTYTMGDTSYLYNIDGYNSFYFKKTGTASVTVASKKNQNVSETIEVTSEYVPVTSVVPAISGTITLHGRNANSSNGKDFIPTYGTVIVTPENASNRQNYTVASSNPEVANFVVDFVHGYVPKKAGTTTYTASIEDISPDGTKKVVTGSSTVTYRYQNPLTEIKQEVQELVLENNTNKEIPITLIGELSDKGYSVTEPELVWTFDKPGIVKIQQSKGAWKRDESAPDNNCYFLGTEYTAYAQGQGTVIATGTPVDETKGVLPVTIKITVTAGNALEANVADMVDTGLKGAIGYLDSKHDGAYVYGEEWAVFTLLRAGQEIPKQQLDDYYASLVKKVRKFQKDDKPTDIERVALALSAMGKDITDVDGVNLAALIYDNTTLSSGSNELIYALLALDAANIKIPDDALWSREKIIKELLSFQNENGGFGLFSSSTVSMDMTAMAIQALASYAKTDSEAENAISNALMYLRANQNASYGFDNGAETAAQVLMALCALSLDPTDPANGFGTKYSNLITFLNEFYSEKTGGYSHEVGGETNMMASIQVLQAYSAFQMYREGKGSYWNLSEKMDEIIVELPERDPVIPEAGQGGGNSEQKPSNDVTTTPEEKPMIPERPEGTVDSEQTTTPVTTVRPGTVGNSGTMENSGTAENSGTVNDSGAVNKPGHATVSAQTENQEQTIDSQQGTNSEDAPEQGHGNDTSGNTQKPASSMTDDIQQGQPGVSPSSAMTGALQETVSEEESAQNGQQEESLEEDEEESSEKVQEGWTFTGEDYVKEDSNKVQTEKQKNKAGNMVIILIGAAMAICTAAGIVYRTRIRKNTKEKNVESK